ncbi:asparagine synthase B [Flavobacteriales bacterium]|nr:asparagine synthase B [Flavobacteriales bacterium]
MCSITALLNRSQEADSDRQTVLEASLCQRHRGPDWSGVIEHPGAIIAHERLAIVDVLSGAQPMVDPEKQTILAVNGEIYNHQELRTSESAKGYPFQSASDCEVILALHRNCGAQLVEKLSGMYAFVLFDPETDHWMIARDPIGIIPLYHGTDGEGRLWVASEMKALTDVCDDVRLFPPGHVWEKGQDAPVQFYTRDWMTGELPNAPYKPEELNEALTDAVRKHLMGDVPYGLLISGGLDSSVIAAIAMKHAARRVDDGGHTEAWWPRVHSFSIGLDGSPDLAAAKEVAEAIGTVHHGLQFTIQEGIDALSEVIRHIETYDVTTIRASTPMYLMARKIKAMGIKMVLSGEGADELFGGYLYFHMAPDAKEFHEETVRKVLGLHQYDCARANKSMMAWGIEARVPFLDREFIDYAMNLDPAAKMGGAGRIEKAAIRQAFEGYIPDHILNRQKEQFSDGVGYGWIDGLRDHAEAQVSDAEMERAAVRFPIHPPATKEGYFYRKLFEVHYPSAAAAATVPGGKSVACSTERALEWDARLKDNIDPSGRAVGGIHNDAYNPE